MGDEIRRWTGDKFIDPTGNQALRNVKCKVMLTEAYFEPKNYDVPFLTLVKPYFKNVFNSIELPLSFVFYFTHHFMKKLAEKTLKTSREKVFS